MSASLEGPTKLQYHDAVFTIKLRKRDLSIDNDRQAHATASFGVVETFPFRATFSMLQCN